MDSLISSGRPEYLIESGKKRFRLQEPLLFQFDGKTIIVPAGFTCDLASVPSLFFWWRWGKYNISAIVHDYNYIFQEVLYLGDGSGSSPDIRVEKITRTQSDRLFWQLNRVLGVNPLVNYLMWLAVRLGGWFYWERSRQHFTQDRNSL